MEDKIWIKAYGYTGTSVSSNYSFIGEWKGERKITLATAKNVIEVWLNEHFLNDWECEGSGDIPFYIVKGNYFNRPILLQYDDPSRQLAFSAKAFAIENIELLRDIQQCLIVGEIIEAQNTAEQYRIAFKQANLKAQENIEARYREWEHGDLKILDYEGKR